MTPRSYSCTTRTAFISTNPPAIRTPSSGTRSTLLNITTLPVWLGRVGRGQVGGGNRAVGARRDGARPAAAARGRVRLDPRGPHRGLQRRGVGVGVHELDVQRAAAPAAA